MSAPLLHRLLSPEECYEFSALLEAKWLARIKDVGQGPPSLSKAAAGQSPNEPAFPISPYSGELESDSWDLASEELCLTADLGGGWRSGRDRAGYDEHDDKSDIAQHERRTSFPWGGNK